MWTTFEQCAAYLDERGLATILPAKNQFLPCLLWGARGHEGPFLDWDEACDRVWKWKDELPQRREAFSGRLWGAQVILLHRRLLPAFLRWREADRDMLQRYRAGQLSREARSIVHALENEDSLGRRELRRRAGLAGKERTSGFERGCKELERAFLLTRSGRASEGSGWDSCSYSLVSRHFPAQLRASQDFSAAQAEQAVEAACCSACPNLERTRLMRLIGAKKPYL